MPCMACIFALYCLALAVPKMLFREHLCARFWHRLGLESCWGSGVSEPCPTVRHTAFPRYSGSSQHLWLCPTSHTPPFQECIALYAFSGSEDAISKASLRMLLAPPWGLNLAGVPLFPMHVPHNPFRRNWLPLGAWILVGMRCFATMLSQCSTRLFHGTGRSIQTSMALPSMFCMPCFAVVWLVFSGSEDAISRASLRPLLAPPWAWILLGIRCFATMPHRAPQHFSTVLRFIQASLALPCMPCKLLCIALYVAVPKIAILRASLRTFLAPPWAWILLGIRCFATMPHRAPQGFSTVFRFIQTSRALPSVPCMACIFALYCLVFGGSEDALSKASLRTLLAPPWA